MIFTKYKYILYIIEKFFLSMIRIKYAFATSYFITINNDNGYPNHFGTRLTVLHFEQRIYWLIPGAYLTFIEQCPQKNTLFTKFSYPAAAADTLSFYTLPEQFPILLTTWQE
jgi:hypothetical protein